MQEYEYKARDSSGELITGVVEGTSIQDVTIKISDMGYFLVSVKVKSEGGGSLLELDLMAAFQKVKVKEITQFTIELATLLDAGVSLLSSLEIEESQLKKGPLKEAVKKIVIDIKQGLSFSEALGKHPKIFTSIYVGLIKAGEVSGQLDVILVELAGYLEVNDENKNKVKSALMYPQIMIAVSTMVCMFLLTFVLPRFRDIFSTAGVELPTPTRVLLDISDYLKESWYVVVGVVILVIVGFKFIIKTKEGREIYDDLVFKVPIVKSLMSKSIIARFTRTFGSLVKSSVPMMQALDILKESVGNVQMEHLIDRIKLKVNDGERISDELEKSKYIPPMVSRMVGVGEDTGALDNMLTKVSNYYERELDLEIKGLTSVIEPLIIVVMGVVIGGIVLAVMLPMFDMIKLVK